MRTSAALSFGGFLIGLGTGWYLFTSLDVSSTVFAWFLIIVGMSIVASSLLSWKHIYIPLRGLVGSLSAGLLLSLFVTSGFGFLQDIAGIGVLPYRADGVKSYSGAATVDKVYLQVDNFNGAVHVSTWDRSEFSLNLTIVARGYSQSDAEDILKELKIGFDENVVQDQKRLTLQYDVSSSRRSRYSIEVHATLPAKAVIDLDLRSSNGGIYLAKLRGGILKMETSNGPLVFEEVYAESLTGQTSNGRIEGKAEAKMALLYTSNGRIDLTLPCTVSGSYDLRTSNANVDFRVSSSTQIGYDLDLSTSNGGITINLSGLSYSRNQQTSKKAQTEGFNSKAVQVTIKATTSNGSILVDAPRSGQIQT